MTKSKKSKVTPLNVYILIRPEEKPKETDSGIVLAETNKKERPFFGQVLQASANVKQVKPGDWVHFQRLGPVAVTVDDEELYYVVEKDILGVVAF